MAIDQDKTDLLAALDALIPKPTPTFHKETYPRLAPSKTTFDAKNKTVLITAGATGIGFEISRAFAQAGVKKIVILSRRPEPQIKAKTTLEKDFPGLEVLCHSVSVTDYDAITKTLHDEISDIDILILSHAIAEQATANSYTDLPLTELRDVFETNVLACVHLVQTYLKLPPSTSGAGKTVIHVSSASAHMSLPGQLGYGSSKTAISRMLGYFADGKSPAAAAAAGGEGKGARIFSFHPGAFYTEAAAKLVPENAMIWEDIKLPAHFAVWPASPEADFLHGRFVWAHWDVDEMMRTFPARLAKEPNFLRFDVKV